MSADAADVIEALRERLAAQGVHTLVAQFTDLNGVAKGKYLPLAQLRTLVETGAGFSGPSIAGTGLPRMGPRSEYYGRGDIASARALPWMPGYARLVCDGFVAGQPFDACPRQVLRRQIARLAERGWSLQTGIEPEFMLLTRDANGKLKPFDDTDTLDNPPLFQTVATPLLDADGLAVPLLEFGFVVEQIDLGRPAGHAEPDDALDLRRVMERYRSLGRLGRDVRAVHLDVHMLLQAGVLRKDDEGRIEFPYTAVHVDFMVKAAA